MSLPAITSLCFKSPMFHRFFVGASLLLGCLATPVSAAAQSEASADDAVRAALARPEVEERFSAQVDGVRAELNEATVFPTPTLGLAHEQVFGDLNVGFLEFSAMVQQRFDLSGWRGALRESLPHRESALRAETDTWQLEAATTVREAFYLVRRHDERIATVDAWIARLERGLVGVRAREERGDASAYQVRRMERERELARATRANQASAQAEAWADLERWTTWQTRPVLVGELQPSTPSRPTEAPAPLRPELARLEHIELALDAQAQAWGSPFWRDWSIGAGYRYAEVGPSTGHGFLVSLSLPLAFWNTDAPRLQRLRARQHEVSTELTLRTSLVEREVDAAAERLDAALRALETMPSPARAAELTQLAQVAFDAGEASLTELLDAFESETELQLARIDLQWEARRAAIALDRSRGIGVPP